MITAGTIPTPAILMIHIPEAGQSLVTGVTRLGLSGVTMAVVGTSLTPIATRSDAYDQPHRMTSLDHPSY